ncbi:DUF378 domain-containing protein [Candidatus Peregrinibacteria bacterium]|jgi:uncharacterized membrane protein YuzA (DUF378 family)|nr:DUF378 domain-containing protein [Candidatus Peregrinibacteria bacterium]MBT4056249.1 DUF378 domain-containing protein [Candidatus Peregrinibacteria bacterium]
MKVLHWIIGLLLIVGGLNWGLAGLGYFLDMNLNVVNLLLGGMPVVEAIVYLLVGVAALAALVGVFACKHCCGKECKSEGDCKNEKGESCCE